MIIKKKRNYRPQKQLSKQCKAIKKVSNQKQLTQNNKER
jgi:hypothetical protein